MLEDVQKKAIGMISGLRSRDYAAKLQELDLWSLQKRRVMCDLIQVYKVANEIGNVKCGLQFNQDRVANNIPTRHQADPLNRVKKRANLDIRKYFFCNRVVDKWNEIPTAIKQANTVPRFKRELVKWMKLDVN